MRIIDSHVHVWIHDRAYPWAGDDADIPRDNACPDALINLMQRNGVGQAVLVQYIKYKWDNLYVAHTMKAHPSLFAGVCRVDPQDPANPDQLSYWTEMHGFRGVRLSPDADGRGDWFTGPLMPPLFRRAAALHVPLLILTAPSRLPDLAAIVEKVPDAQVVIDHMADCISPHGNHLGILLALARYPNVFLKLGHVAESSAQLYPWQDTYEVMERIFQTYGAHRIMWGSDWPLCFMNTASTYARSIAYVQNELPFLTPADRAWVLGKTAARFWPFTDEAGAEMQRDSSGSH
jgi:L-fuconolactonase